MFQIFHGKKSGAGRAAALVLILTVAACGGNPPRYILDVPPSALRVNTPVKTLLLHEVSLPGYAAADEIPSLQDGAVRDYKKALWADQPSRGVTLALAQSLDTILSATVAAEPWPLAGAPEAEIDVRVRTSLANDGSYRLAGVYYLLSEGPRAGRSSATFDLSVPMTGDGPAAVADAQGRAVAALADQIARGLGR